MASGRLSGHRPVRRARVAAGWLVVALVCMVPGGAAELCDAEQNETACDRPAVQVDNGKLLGFSIPIVAGVLMLIAWRRR